MRQNKINTTVNQSLNAKNVLLHIQYITAAEEELRAAKRAKEKGEDIDIPALVKELNTNISNCVAEMLEEQNIEQQKFEKARKARKDNPKVPRVAVFPRAVDLNEKTIFACHMTRGITICVYYTKQAYVAIFTRSSDKAKGGYIIVDASGKILERYETAHEFASDKMLSKLNFKVKDAIEARNNTAVRSYHQLKGEAALNAVTNFIPKVVLEKAIAEFEAMYRPKLVDLSFNETVLEIPEIPQIVADKEQLPTEREVSLAFDLAEIDVVVQQGPAGKPEEIEFPLAEEKEKVSVKKRKAKAGAGTAGKAAKKSGKKATL